MIKLKRKRFLKKPVPFIKLFPNLVTLVGLIIGVNSLRFAVEAKWEQALYCIVIATIIDGIDGRLARFLNATSQFGAELDSLCDFVNFGVCPAIVTYLWSLQHPQFKIIAWAVMMLWIVCMAIRLARFNTSVLVADSKSDDMFFQGVPAPSGALLALLPMILELEIAPVLGIDIRGYMAGIFVYVLIISLLVASRIPTFSPKKLQIKPEYLSLVMVALSLTIISIYIYTWYFIPIVGIIYLMSIPFCVYVFRKRQLSEH